VRKRWSRAQKQAYEKAGRRAENLACLYLRLKGYRILERRFKVRGGEVDVIARKKNVIAMIEVKQRASESAAQMSVSYENQSRLMDAAEIYINQTRGVRRLPPQASQKGTNEISHVPLMMLAPNA